MRQKCYETVSHKRNTIKCAQFFPVLQCAVWSHATLNYLCSWMKVIVDRSSTANMRYIYTPYKNGKINPHFKLHEKKYWKWNLSFTWIEMLLYPGEGENDEEGNRNFSLYRFASHRISSWNGISNRIELLLLHFTELLEPSYVHARCSIL
jgi:hypothetical protein